MKPKTLILMLVAVACGLVAAFLASQYQPSASEQKVPVVVAQVDLPAGTKITDPAKMLMIKGFPADAEPPKSYKNPEDLRNQVVSRTIDKNVPITAGDLSMAESLFKPCPPGFRAISVRVNLEDATSGFTLPGSFVDLLCTLPDPTDARRTLTKTFMQNVMVLAVNTQREQPKEGGGVIQNPGMLTVAVKPEDVERLIAAGARGTVKMSLRRPGEKEVVETKGVTNPFLETDAAKSDGTGGEKGQTVKVWVAEKSLLPGTEIDKVGAETFFKLVPYPQSLAKNALTEKDDLKGRLAHLVPEGFPITRDHYQTLGKLDTVKSAVHVLRIQEGAKVPVDYVFENGRSITGGSGRESLPEPDPKPAPAPKGRGSEGPSESN